MRPRIFQLFADANTPLIDNPELTHRSFHGSQSSASQNQVHHFVERLLSGSKDPDATMTTRWVSSDIGEIQVESDQDPIFQGACCQEGGIAGSGQALRDGCLDVVPKVA